MARREAVAGLEAEVLEEFLEQLTEDSSINDTVVNGLRDYLTRAKMPSAEQLAQLFASGSGEQLA